MTKVTYIKINLPQVGQRLDNFLFKRLKTIPKSRIYKALRKGEVRVNKKRVKPEYKLKEEDEVRVPPFRIEEVEPKRRPGEVALSKLLAQVLYEDSNLLIINKPEGLPVHAGTGVDFGVIDILRLKNADYELAHRLDRDTSGCLIVAKGRQSLLKIHEVLKNGHIQKDYLAVTTASWPRPEMLIDQPVAKSPNHKMKDAQTEIEVLSSHEGIAHIKARLLTGRTHQIRIHCAQMGCPVLGDDLYGDRALNRELGLKRLYLHAAYLAFELDGKKITISAPEPKAFKIISKLTKNS